MENFIGWLKFYFLGFFSNELSGEGASRSFWNVLLSFLLAFVLVCGGLVAGYAASFGSHYENSGEFRKFLYSAFADDGSSKRIDLSVSGGKLSAAIPNGKQSVNSFDEENAEYIVNGYKLVLDTRRADNTFDDFTLICKDANGNAITYEEYKAMSEEDKKTASVVINYSGKSIDTVLRQPNYVSYLDKVSASSDKEYDEDIADAYAALKLKESELDERAYADEIYKLYVKAYYPILAGVDAYGGAPTLRTYYMNSKMYANEDKYLILLDDVCICTFITANGIPVDYAGNFNNADDCVITADGLTSGEMQANIDEFINNTFNSGRGLTFFVYVVSLFKLLPLFAVIMVFIALVCFLVYKIKRIEFYGKFIGMFKVACSYILISSLLAFVVSMISSFFVSRGTVYLLAGITVIAVIAVRMAVLVAMEIIKAVKDSKPAESSNQD